jgi:hypothetical protein
VALVRVLQLVPALELPRAVESVPLSVIAQVLMLLTTFRLQCHLG